MVYYPCLYYPGTTSHVLWEPMESDSPEKKILKLQILGMFLPHSDGAY